MKRITDWVVSSATGPIAAFKTRQLALDAVSALSREFDVFVYERVRDTYETQTLCTRERRPQ